MLTQAIVIVPTFPALPTALRYIQTAVDGLGSISHQLQAQDVADACGFFYGVVTGQVAPTGGTLVGVVGNANTWVGANTFSDFTMSGATRIKLGTRSLTRVADGPMQLGIAGTISVHVPLGIPQNDIGVWEVHVPDGATITDIKVWVDPVNATPPAGVKNTLKLYRYDVTASTSTQVGSTGTDPTTGASYGTPHSWTLSANGGGAIAQVADRTKYRFFVQLVGETGSGASQVNSGGVAVIFTPATMDDGAA